MTVPRGRRQKVPPLQQGHVANACEARVAGGTLAPCECKCVPRAFLSLHIWVHPSMGQGRSVAWARKWSSASAGVATAARRRAAAVVAVAVAVTAGVVVAVAVPAVCAAGGA